jgi:hypothetical protein
MQIERKTGRRQLGGEIRRFHRPIVISSFSGSATIPLVRRNHGIEVANHGILDSGCICRQALPCLDIGRFHSSPPSSRSIGALF